MDLLDLIFEKFGMANAGVTTNRAPEKRAISPLRPNEPVSGRICECSSSRSCLSPIPFEAVRMPVGLQVERPVYSREARVQIPVPCERNSSETSCSRLSRCFFEIYGECRWEYIGNQRIQIPPDQPQGRLRILINPCRHSDL